MIKIEKNTSFPEWIDIFAFGEFVEQVKGRAKALRIASKLARKNGQKSVLAHGKLVELD
tara:strand:- start:2058 stop:2234 length:177 start_codon:yes stop_codon:yes gene_type:complete